MSDQKKQPKEQPTEMENINEQRDSEKMNPDVPTVETGGFDPRLKKPERSAIEKDPIEQSDRNTKEHAAGRAGETDPDDRSAAE